MMLNFRHSIIHSFLDLNAFNKKEEDYIINAYSYLFLTWPVETETSFKVAIIPNFFHYLFY